MTLVVGIKCSDGVVLGADGAATFTATGGQPTIMQPVRKLAIVGESAIIGVSGPVGHAQRIQPIIAEMLRGSDFGGQSATDKTGADAMTAVRQKIWPLLGQELHIAAEAAKAVGQPLALQGALSACLLAVPVSKRPSLFHFDYQGSPCESNQDLPFFSIGSGQQVADPFLAFIRRHLWETAALPTIADATFAAYWTLDYAIKGAPNVGIGEPKQIVVLEKGQKKYFHARELTEGELSEHQQSVDCAHDAMRTFRQNLAAAGASTTTTTPPPLPPVA